VGQQIPTDTEIVVPGRPDAEQFPGYFQAASQAACGPLIALYNGGATIYDNSGKKVKDLLGWIKLASIVILRTGVTVGVSTIAREVGGWQSTHNTDEVNKAIAAVAAGLSTFLVAWTAYDRVKKASFTWSGLAGDAALTAVMWTAFGYSASRGEFNNMGSSAARAYINGYARLIMEVFTRMGANMNDQTYLQQDIFLGQDTFTYMLNRLGIYTLQVLHGVSSGPDADLVDGSDSLGGASSDRGPSSPVDTVTLELEQMTKEINRVIDELGPSTGKAEPRPAPQA
jgi:hypothetical protein